ncbi:MAG: aminopeptidase, partial [Mycoplasmataceae bacterium]|nr:aminopeptidase [Mycoplasmataceae bacterium]
MSLNKLIDKYAQLVAKGGINVQKGQVVFISCDIDAKDFCKLVVEKCYKLGAKEVIVAYNDYEA